MLNLKVFSLDLSMEDFTTEFSESEEVYCKSYRKKISLNKKPTKY